MSFLRPELAASFRRWREVIAGAALLVAALWLLHSGWTRADTIRQGLGVLVAIAGAAVVAGGWWRARLAPGGTDPGIVQVTEGRIVYMGPHDGGLAALDAITRIDIRTLPDGRAVWVIHQQANPPLIVPLRAAGAEALFDRFAALPGLSPARLARIMRNPRPGRTVIWRAPPAALDSRGTPGHL